MCDMGTQAKGIHVQKAASLVVYYGDPVTGVLKERGDFRSVCSLVYNSFFHIKYCYSYMHHCVHSITRSFKVKLGLNGIAFGGRRDIDYFSLLYNKRGGGRIYFPVISVIEAFKLV